MLESLTESGLCPPHHWIILVVSVVEGTGVELVSSETLVSVECFLFCPILSMSMFANIQSMMVMGNNPFRSIFSKKQLFPLARNQDFETEYFG